MKRYIPIVIISFFSIDAFAIEKYKDNYFLPHYHEKNVNQKRFAPMNPNGGDVNDTLIQFQFSLKYSIYGNDSNGLFLAYTQRSNWEAYEKSAYFRDNDFNPALFYSYTMLDSLNLSLGVEHQSNGAGGTNEVSWNRGFLDIKYEGEHGYVRVKPWVRFSDKTDYNPDIEDFLGNFEMEALYNITENTTLRMLVRNPFEKNYYETSFTFPIFGRLKGYIMYESGYGSTISNYDFKSDSYGVGFSLN
ncbi:phospholipase A [Shewanella waksmanii]|uniref:phospholipase A n=1 Tax=Shewanella waksmanii TaxID=213783 RepID=UPI003736FF8A